MYQTKNGDLERGNDSIFVVGDCNKRQKTAVTTTNEVVELCRLHQKTSAADRAFSRGNSPARTEQWRVVLSFFVTYCLFSIYSLSWTPSRILLINSICYGWYGIASGYIWCSPETTVIGDGGVRKALLRPHVERHSHYTSLCKYWYVSVMDLNHCSFRGSNYYYYYYYWKEEEEECNK